MALLNTVKDIYELATKGATLELQKELMRLSQEALALQEENIALREEIIKLKENNSRKVEVEWDGTAYWRRKSENEKDGPFCQICYDTEEKLVRLHSFSLPDEYGRMHNFLKCKACEQIFDDSVV